MPRLLSGKKNNEQVSFPDRLQNNSMLLFHATSKKSDCTKHGWQLEPIGKEPPLEFFSEKYLCNSNGFFIPSVFSYSNNLFGPAHHSKVSFDYLVFKCSVF